MMRIEHHLYVSYSQIAVFRVDLENPFNDWSKQHVRQGFSWREGSVSFRTLWEAGHVRVTVEQVGFLADLSPNTRRCIRVPFEVPGEGLVEIASITDGFRVRLSPGVFGLLCEIGGDETDAWCSLTFAEQGDKTPAILKADAELGSVASLWMSAEPADG